MRKILTICCMLISIILMATPYGIAMTFASGPNERITNYYSYFNMMPLGYGNWLPIITAVLSIVVLMILLINLRSGKWEKSALICSVICLIASILSWLIFSSFTIIGAVIAIFHGAAILFQIREVYMVFINKAFSYLWRYIFGIFIAVLFYGLLAFIFKLALITVQGPTLFSTISQ